jgi:hypothetical protein
MGERRGLAILLVLILQVVIVVFVVAVAAEEAPALQQHRLFATSANLGIVEINPGTGAILNSFSAPVNQGVSDGLAFDGQTLYYLSGSWDSNTLYALNPNTGATVVTYTLPASAFRNGLATLNGLVYILDWSVLTQDITIFDPQSETVVGTLDIDGTNPGAPLISGGLAGIKYPDALLVTTSSTNELLEIDPTTGAITNQFAHSQGNGTLGAAAVNGQIYLGSNTSDTLSIYDRSGNLQGSVTIPGSVGVQSLGGDDAGTTGPPTITVTKTVTPSGTVAYGDQLTYTLMISTVPGTEVGIYDPLTDMAFIGFVPQATPGITYTNGAITGSLTITPTPQATLTFVVQVSEGQAVSVTNRACSYLLPGTPAECQWSNRVTNDILQPPGIPVQRSPADGTVTTNQTITFTWQAGVGSTPDGYHLELDGAVFSTTNTTSSTVLSLGVHTWTVRAYNGAGYSAWAPAWTVTVQKEEEMFIIYLPLVLRQGP